MILKFTRITAARYVVAACVVSTLAAPLTTAFADDAVNGETSKPTKSVAKNAPSANRVDVMIYQVQPGDAVERIARRFDLQIQTLLSANPKVAKPPHLLQIGQTLVIPPSDGVFYSIQSGDTLEAIALKFKSSSQTIVGFAPNGIVDANVLSVGAMIFIPSGATSDAPGSPALVSTKDDAATSTFIWPADGPVTRGFSGWHPGLDIACRMGTPVVASADGTVIRAGWDNMGYGWMVWIEHDNGYKTLYAHLSRYDVDAGQIVRQGQLIGLSGNSGNSLGPHLHFEISLNGAKQNVMRLLP